MAPLAKFTSSWQEPQAARLGSFIQALVCAAPFFGLWQLPAQFRGSLGFEGYTTVDQSE
jgi:hypothetical protein